MNASPDSTSTTLGVAPPGYRLPASTRPGPVRLKVSDLTASLRFYTQVLGFEVLEQSGDIAALGAFGNVSPLLTLEADPDVGPVPRRGRLGLFHVAYLLPTRADLARFVRHLRNQGVRAGMSDHHVSEAIYLSDPDGLGVEVYADRPPETWEHDGQEIAMATDPLDVLGLLAVGNGKWSGLPENTRVGHVHLHIGDLNAAADFYHEALGLDKMAWSHPGALFLGAGGYHHHLGINTWAGDASPPRNDDAQLLEWTLELPGPRDVEAIAHHLDAKGVDRKGSNDEVVLADPWGTQVRLVAQEK